MSYVDGYLVPVRTDKREDYRKMASEAAAIWKESARRLSWRLGATTCPRARSPRFRWP